MLRVHMYQMYSYLLLMPQQSDPCQPKVHLKSKLRKVCFYQYQIFVCFNTIDNGTFVVWHFNTMSGIMGLHTWAK